MSLTITIPGAVNVTTGATAPATLTVGVGVPGATGPAGPGVPAGGTAGQFLTKINSTNYNTDWTTVNFSQYLTTSAAAAIYQPLSGMSSYLTTASAASTYQPLSGMSSYLTTSSAASTYAPLARGLPASGTVGQVLTKVNGTDYNASWQTLVPGDRYLSSSTTSLTISTGAKTLTIGTGLSYSSQQDIVIAYDAANHMHAVVTSYDSSTGALVVDVQNKTGSGTYSLWTVNVGGTTPLQSVYWGEILGTLGDQSDLATALNAKLETSTAASTYAALAGATFTGEVATPASTTSSAGFSIAPGTAPSAPTNGEIWNTGSDLQVRIGGVTETLAEQSWVTAQGYITSSALSPYLLSSTAASTYQTIAGMSSYLTTSAASTTYAALAGATFTGLVNTPAATTTTAGFRLPHGTAPTTPTDGDVWTTTGNLWVRISGASQAVALQGSSAQLSSNNIFTNASSTYGNSTAAGTINLGTGATISGATKAINIGTAGVSGSTTNIAIGSAVSGATTTTTINGNITATGTTLTLGNSTAASTYNIGTGATLTATTKAINIGTAGVAGSTTNIAIGSATSTTTTTVEGTITANGATLNLGTSTAAATYNLGTGATLTATTKAVNIGTNGVAGSTTNIAIGSTTGTSTTTLQGTTNAVTAAQNTNTTQVATTAFVLGQASSTTPVVDGTAAVGTATTFARADHVHPTDTSRAALASPTFTGTPAAPTAAVDTNTTQLATTAYVVGQGYLKSATASSTYAPLASPALTGTPTAPTATAGTNTTQIATTAFVTAAVPAYATNTQAITGSSTTTLINPSVLNQVVMYPGYRAFNSMIGNYSSTQSGTAGLSIYTDYVSPYVNTANGKMMFNPSSGANVQAQSRGVGELTFDWTKPVWIAGRFGYSGSLNGDTSTTVRVTLGKTASTFGDLSTKGIGWKVLGGTASPITLMVHNGTTLTTVSTGITLSSTAVFPTTTAFADWAIYSDGAGNVTLYLNGTSYATTNAGPNSGTASSIRYAFETDNGGAPNAFCAPVHGGIKMLN